MGWYIELHCDTPECPHGCAEEGHQGRSTKEVAAEARRWGWNQIAGLWRCPGCLRDLGLPVKITARPAEAAEQTNAFAEIAKAERAT